MRHTLKELRDILTASLAQSRTEYERDDLYGVSALASMAETQRRRAQPIASAFQELGKAAHRFATLQAQQIADQRIAEWTERRASRLLGEMREAFPRFDWRCTTPEEQATRGLVFGMCSGVLVFIHEEHQGSTLWSVEVMRHGGGCASSAQSSCAIQGFTAAFTMLQESAQACHDLGIRWLDERLDAMGHHMREDD